MLTRILIVDNDTMLADVLAFTLRRAGFDALLAHDGLAALDLYARERPDLIVLAWILPLCDGLQVCKRIRAESSVPIIMLTVRSGDDDVVAALAAGADDYVTKPFSPRQLVARIQALLRRAVGKPVNTLHAGALSLDPSRHEACWEGDAPIHLTSLEMRLLQALIQNAGQVLTANALIARVWGPGKGTHEMLRQVLHRLRNKIEPHPATPTVIETIPDIGYTLHPLQRQHRRKVDCEVNTVTAPQ